MLGHNNLLGSPSPFELAPPLGRFRSAAFGAAGSSRGLAGMKVEAENSPGIAAEKQEMESSQNGKYPKGGTTKDGNFMHAVMSTRGPFMVCDACFAMLKDEAKVDERGRAVSDSVADEFCINCYDRNKILIDDLTGSTE